MRSPHRGPAEIEPGSASGRRARPTGDRPGRSATVIDHGLRSPLPRLSAARRAPRANLWSARPRSGRPASGTARAKARPYNGWRAVFLLSLAAAIVAAITVNFAAKPAAAAAESSRSEAPSSTLRLNRTLRRHYQLRQRWEHLAAQTRRSSWRCTRSASRMRGGGTSRSGFDCSGLVRWVYSNLGVSLPHYTVTQFHHGFSVRRRALKSRETSLFFNGLRHVGLYIGHGDVVHSHRTPAHGLAWRRSSRVGRFRQAHAG